MTWILLQLARVPKKYWVYLGIIIAAAWGLRMYSNYAYSKGKEAGRLEMADELIKEKQEEWQAREKQLADQAAAQEKAIAEKRAQVNAQLAEINRQRGETRTALNQFVDTLERQKAKQYENVYSIPAVELDAAIRNLSNRLAAAAE
jgi:DNA-binding transcriptional MerR regulator